MNYEKTNNEKLILSLNNNLKVHLILEDGTWRNGFVKELKGDYFLFEDKKNGVEPIFFLDLKKVEPYLEEE